MACGAQHLAGFNDAISHGTLSLFQVRTWIVNLLVTDFAINLEHAVVVAKHVARNRIGERILRIGINIHLDHAIAQGFFDLGGLGTGTAVEDVIEGLGTVGKPQLLGSDLLAFGQYLWAQLDVARLIDAMDVTESGSQQVATIFASAQRIDGFFKIFWGGVQVSTCFR